MRAAANTLDAAEEAQFREAFHDNLDLVLDILEAMRCESTHAADPTSAIFLAGMHQALHAYGRLRGSSPGFSPTSRLGAWPEPFAGSRI